MKFSHKLQINKKITKTQNNCQSLNEKVVLFSGKIIYPEPELSLVIV